MMIGPCHFYGTLPTDIGVTSYKLVPVWDGVTFGPESLAIRGPSADCTKQLLEKQRSAASAKPPPPNVVSLTGSFSGAVRPRTTLTAGDHNTGIFVVQESSPPFGSELTFEMFNAAEYDLQRFGAQVVRNGDEFAIPGILCDQDDMQLITYWWGEDYLNHCIEHDDGAFLETHDFPQLITPLSEECGGHILLARPVSMGDSTTMEVVAVHIPFGYTIILGKNAWHGDMSLKGLHLMAMTANHLIMEGTTKSWFLKNGMGGSRSELTENLRFRAECRSGCRECRQAGAIGNPAVPAEIQSLLRCENTFACDYLDQSVRHEHWDTFTDEVIRKYAPWSTPSSERIAVDPKTASQFMMLGDVEGSAQIPGASSEQLYVEHQHDLAYRFSHGSVQLFDTQGITVGPMSEVWMLRSPRECHWRHLIGRIVGRTLAGEAMFTLPNIWSDSTVGNILDLACLDSRKKSYSIVSWGSNAEIMPESFVVSKYYPDQSQPQME
jgi:hypothetical protein